MNSLERFAEVWPLLGPKQQMTLLALAEIAANEAKLAQPFGSRYTQAINIALTPEKCILRVVTSNATNRVVFSFKKRIATFMFSAPEALQNLCSRH